MGKSPEDKIREKLVDLELSIQDEESKQTPAAGAGSALANGRNSTGTALVKADESLVSEVQLYKFAGVALCTTSLIMLLGHAGLSTSWMMMWGRGPSVGVMLLPLLIGASMMIYNYKSKLAQAIVVGSLALFVLALISSLVVTFSYMSVLDFLFMAAPLCAGLAVLTKGYAKSREFAKLSQSSSKD